MLPVLEDWLWHAIFPLIAYMALAIAAALLRRQPTPCLFTIGATAVFLLFIGIHNAWDAVTYIALTRRGETDTATEKITIPTDSTGAT